MLLKVTHVQKCPNPNAQIDINSTHKVHKERATHRLVHAHTHPLVHKHSHTQTHTMFEMAQTSWGTQLATITPPGMNHLLLIPAHSPPLAYSSQLDFRICLFSNHFHKSLLIDPRIAPDSGVPLLFGFQAVAGFVPWLFTGWTSLWRWLIST